MEGLEYQSVRQTQSDGGVRSVIKPNFETETAKLGVCAQFLQAWLVASTIIVPVAVLAASEHHCLPVF